MPDLDLRPLSLGEILDRAFTLYRRNFLLFTGIIAIPQLMVLAFNLAQTFMKGARAANVAGSVSTSLGVTLMILGLVGVIVYFVAYLFAHGGTVYTVSDQRYAPSPARTLQRGARTYRRARSDKYCR
jgi:hypothetical protein